MRNIDEKNNSESKKKVFYEQLIEMLRTLASDHLIQIKAFPHFVNVPDELALTFEDIFLFAEQIEKEGLINRELRQKLKEIDDIFNNQSGDKHADFWTLESLKADPLWERIRQLAKDILNDLKVDDSLPNIKLKYIQAK